MMIIIFKLHKNNVDSNNMDLCPVPPIIFYYANELAKSLFGAKSHFVTVTAAINIEEKEFLDK